MSEKTLSRKNKYTLCPPAAELPELVTTCPKCGGEVDLCTQEETYCIFCDHKLFDRETTLH
jgi:hypothetical protein